MLLVINCDMFPYPQFRRHKLAQVLEVGEYARQGKLVAVVWSCDNRGLANMQAELLWEKGLPVRVVENEDERDAFVREILTNNQQ